MDLRDFPLFSVRQPPRKSPSYAHIRSIFEIPVSQTSYVRIFHKFKIDRSTNSGMLLSDPASYSTKASPLRSSGLGHPPPFSGKISFIRNPRRYYLCSTWVVPSLYLGCLVGLSPPGLSTATVLLLSPWSLCADGGGGLSGLWPALRPCGGIGASHHSLSSGGSEVLHAQRLGVPGSQAPQAGWGSQDRHCV